MLWLSSSALIGKGLHRECYIHPYNRDVCVKVIYHPGGITETRREINYYRHLQRRLMDCLILPQYHGAVRTNRGTGYLFDFVRNNDGSAAATLEDILNCNSALEKNLSPLVRSLVQLKEQLLKQRIITMTLKPKNIIYRRKHKNSGHLIIVDNIGDAALIPITTYIPAFATAKIERTWQRFIHSLSQHNPDSPLQKKLMQQYWYDVGKG